MSRAPTALVTNDDGIEARGLRVLAAAAVEAGLDVLVAAPHVERSGASASLSALEEGGALATSRVGLDGLPGVRALAVEASPALIAFLAAHGGFGAVPDVVLSGVNHGPNTGQAVLHSGTVGAAMTGVTHGLAGVAFSLASSSATHWDSAALVVRAVLPWLVERLHGDGLGDAVVNVNVPDVPPDRLRGLREAPLASFGAVQAEVADVDGDRLAVTFSEIAAERGGDTDAALLLDGWATLTAVRAPCRSDAVDLSALAATRLPPR